MSLIYIGLGGGLGAVSRFLLTEYIYNNISNDMQFSEDVKMDYLENTIFSDRANFNNYENQLLIAGNVRGDGPTTNLKADELDFDLNTKDLKISMYSEERVKIKTKF